jgi:hypothetical protein
VRINSKVILVVTDEKLWGAVESSFELFFESTLGTCFIKRGKSWYKHSYAVNNDELPRAPHRHTLTQITGLTVELKQRTK